MSLKHGIDKAVEAITKALDRAGVPVKYIGRNQADRHNFRQ